MGLYACLVAVHLHCLFVLVYLLFIVVTDLLVVVYLLGYGVRCCVICVSVCSVC